jgi:hypothetical protein
MSPTVAMGDAARCSRPVFEVRLLIARRESE